jgi:hypothetical protein
MNGSLFCAFAFPITRQQALRRLRAVIPRNSARATRAPLREQMTSRGRSVFHLTSLVHAEAGRFRAVIGACAAAIELAVAQDSLAGLNQAVAAATGALDGRSASVIARHCRHSPIFAFEFACGNANVYGLLLAKFRARKTGR